MHHFCTLFDNHYLLRGVALYQSLQAHKQPFTFWALCFDEAAYSAVVKLNKPNFRPVALGDFENGDDALLRAKVDRNRAEYFFTCSPSWPLYLLNKFPEIDRITYLDSDLFFFAPPDPIFQHMGDASVLIIPHRFPAHLQYMERNGIYNVGLLSFRNDSKGRLCLTWWRDRCLEWCYDRLEDGKFADQKYLDRWPTLFEGVHVLEHKGANLAPWNWMNYHIRDDAGQIWVDNDPLIFYHFQGLKLLNPWLYDSGTLTYGLMPEHIHRLLYTPYLDGLHDASRWLRQTSAIKRLGYTGIFSRNYGRKMFIRRLLSRQIILLRKSV